jgi:hypothetical protein
VSYRDLVFPNLTAPPLEFGTLWNGIWHPDLVGQDLMAHDVEFALAKELFSAPTGCERYHDDAYPKARHVCAHGVLSDFDAADLVPLKPVRAVGWELFEDSPSKPGFIAVNYSSSSALTFKVDVRLSLQVSVLVSYEKLSPALLYVEGCKDPVALNPIWHDRSSTTKTVMISSNTTEKHEVLPCMQLGSTEITFVAPTGKFKVVKVLSC